jgi:hypothetical protein
MSVIHRRPSCILPMNPGLVLVLVSSLEALPQVKDFFRQPGFLYLYRLQSDPLPPPTILRSVEFHY